MPSSTCPCTSAWPNPEKRAAASATRSQKIETAWSAGKEGSWHPSLTEFGSKLPEISQRKVRPPPWDGDYGWHPEAILLLQFAILALFGRILAKVLQGPLDRVHF